MPRVAFYSSGEAVGALGVKARVACGDELDDGEELAPGCGHGGGMGAARLRHGGGACLTSTKPGAGTVTVSDYGAVTVRDGDCAGAMQCWRQAARD